MKKQKELIKPFELINKALELYNEKIRTLLGIMAMPTLFNLIALFFYPKTNLLGDITIGITSGVISIWAYLSLIYTLREDGLTIKEAFSRSGNKILSYILINFLIAVATIPGIILLGIPTVIYMVWFAFSAFALVEENIHGANALMRSREYVTKRWGKVAWRVFFIMLLIIAFQIVGSLLSKTVAIPAGALFPLESKEITKLISGSFDIIIAFLTVPLSITYTYLLYLNLKETRPKLASQLVNEKYKWLYILSPTTVLLLVIVLIGLFIQIATGI